MFRILCLTVWLGAPAAGQTHAFDEAAMRLKAGAEAIQRQEQALQTAERQEFIERFNRLAQAMQAFQQEFSKSDGTVWPKKKAEALSKAMRQMESTRTWKLYAQSKPQ
jgi:hypothetical protein